MALDAAYIRSRFPGVFDALTDFQLDESINAASAQVSIINLGPVASEATLYLACHMAELGKPGRAGGQHRGKAGQVEIDFGQTGGETSFLLLYRQLIKRTRLGMTVITG